MNKHERVRVLVLSHMYPNRMCPQKGIFIHNQTRHIREAGCNVRVVSPVPLSSGLLRFNDKWRSYMDVPHSDLIDDIQTYYPRYVNLPGKWYRRVLCWSIYCGIRNNVDQIIRNFRPHVIHAHAVTSSGYVALMFSRKYGIPLVCSMRGSDVNVYPHYDRITMMCSRKVISSADQLVSVSNALKEAAEKIGSPKKAIRTIHNGCDPELFFRDADARTRYREKLGISGNDVVIIFVGELKKNKGVFELTAALKRLVPRRPSLHAIILGSGPGQSVIQKEIYAGGMEKRVHLPGNQPHSDISKWLSASDIFVLPSHYEGLPNAVLEAMACGLPVIAARVGGIPEAVADGETGLLIDSKDISSLSGAIACLAANSDLARTMGERGRKVVMTGFSWQYNAAEMIGIYNSLRHAGSPSPGNMMISGKLN
ncbi:MAG: glycosyltransferase family 4 protein [Nitrospirae bacterium]|nr:glycosyltransferase family 4 protein [Nitrospirota bacterium]